jgi:HK97 family phage major capsid protein
MIKRVQELQKLIDSRKQEISAIRSKADVENRQPNPEETVKIAEWLVDLEGFQTNLELCLRQQGIEEKFNKPVNNPLKPDLSPHLDELQAKYPGLPSKENRFSSFGDALVAVREAANPANQVDRRLRAPAGMSEGAPADGGFLIQQDYATEIKTRMFSTGQILPRLTRMPIGANSNSITIPAAADDTESAGIFGGIVAYWLSEAGTKTTSAPKFREMTLKLKKLAAVVPTTDELLADRVALEAFVRLGSNLALVKEAEKQVIRGVGAGQPLGILGSGALVTVAAEAGQLADTILYMNIVNMWSRMYADSRPNAIWLINQSIEPQLYTMGIIVGVGGSPVYQPPGGASASPYGSLFGRPVSPSNHCSKVGDVGDIILADFSQYLWIEKGGIQEAQSMHYAFITDETYYRFVMRVDGQPSWSKVFTPEQATTATQSPFVTLAAR